MTALETSEAILLSTAIAGLILTEFAGALLRRWGFITISEAARKQWRLRVWVAVLIVTTFVWWLIHSAS